MHITKKVRLIPAPFVGTRINIVLDDPESLDWGIYLVTLAEGSSAVTIDWGDGAVEQFSGKISPVHTYPRCGTYAVIISDDLKSFRCSHSMESSPFLMIYAKRIVGVKSNARKLEAIPAVAFYGCENLTEFDVDAASVRDILTRAFYKCTGLVGALRFPAVNNINITAFTDCTGITELHFSETHKAEIEALPGYRTAFGASNAAIFFDL